MSNAVSKADMIRVLGDLASANSGNELATNVLAFGARLKAGEFDVTNEIPQRVGLRQRFDELDALIDLSNPAVFTARRALGTAVGCSIEGSMVTAKTWPPYGPNGGLTDPPSRSLREWLTDWWYRSSRRGYHPQQGAWCACLSFLFGSDIQSGSSWHSDGTNYWWACRRCGEQDSSL